MASRGARFLKAIALKFQRTLGVERQGHPGAWLWRLFILPLPKPGPDGRPDAVLVIMGLLAGRVLDTLAIKATDPWQRWLLRLFILESQPAPETRPGWFARFRAWLPLPTPTGLAAWMDRSWAWVHGRNHWTAMALSASLFVTVLALCIVPLDLAGQILFFLTMYAIAEYLRPVRHAVADLFLIVLSLIVIFRYAFWRTFQTLNVDGFGNHLYAGSLYLAEGFTWLVTVLSFAQMLGPLRRPPKPLPEDIAAWPHVDVYIPTYNEPLEVVRITVHAAKAMDWPEDKLKVYLLDDGRRDSFREFAEDAGIGYITRTDNHHAKAGNLNHALTLTQGEFIAIFDCDHVPVRSFLRTTLGWMLARPELALVQTPHHFYSPDPFERNLGTFREIPNEGYLFNRLVQDGNDLWNAAFFCGSCAVLRRGPLEEVGGIAVETVTEDAHTALKLHRRGYQSAYINRPQAAGLATETLSGHIGQRIRWARGMAQIFRIDNPLLGSGLSLFQRLCYANATMHFFFGLPRLVFLTAPSGYLFFNLHFISAEPLLLLMYGLPYLVFANITNHKIQGRYRHSFWAEVYETVLASYIALPTTFALIHPKFGRFNVTPKGGIIPKSFLDWKISTPYLVLLALNVGGLAVGFYRLGWTPNPEPQVLLMNLFWTAYNLVLLGVVFGVATEKRQLRKSHWIPARLQAILRLGGGAALACETSAFSTEGLALHLDPARYIPLDEPVSVGLYRSGREYLFQGRIVSIDGPRISLRMEFPTPREEAGYVSCTYSRPDAWADWDTVLKRSGVLDSIGEIVGHSGQGYGRLARHFWQGLRMRWS